MARVLGIDYGAKKIGLAIADEEVRIASPLNVIVEENFDNQIARVKKIIEEEEIEKAVIGLPFSKSGEPSVQTKKVQKFVQALKQALGQAVNIFLEDERLTSRMGKKLIEEIGRGPEDAVAAAIILQGFLDRRQLSSSGLQPAR